MVFVRRFWVVFYALQNSDVVGLQTLKEELN